MNKVYGYIRVSTEKQDLEKQKYLIKTFAKENHMKIDETIDIEISSQKSAKARKIDYLLEIVKKGDALIIAELSRLGRNMIETLGIIEKLNNIGVKLYFVRQPELSSSNSTQIQKLILAIYSYFAEAERDFISIRTKQGLEAVRAKGIILGRPKGKKNSKPSIFEQYKHKIDYYLAKSFSLNAIWKLICDEIQNDGNKPLTYNAFRYYINNRK